ncbi:MAG TPA: hypothetical protein VF945_08015 [Polyangia bacterium]
MFPIVVLIAHLTAAPAPVQRAYQKLTAEELQAKRTTVKPPKDARRIDVSSRIRSASFGHQTWLIVAHDGKRFWVEYGRSTNSPPGLFGPFAVEEAATKPTTTTTTTAPPAQQPPAPQQASPPTQQPAPKQK